jgi:hypothetical protein
MGGAASEGCGQELDDAMPTRGKLNERSTFLIAGAFTSLEQSEVACQQWLTARLRPSFAVDDVR